jgi:hypothetical protein
MVIRDIRSLIGIAAIVAIGLPAVTLSQAAKATGTVTVGTTKVAIANATAVGYKAPNGQLVSVLLSDKPADAKEFATDTKTGPGEPLMAGLFEGAWKSQHGEKKFSGFVFTIGPKGNVMTDEFLVGGQNNTFSIGNDEYVIDIKSTSPRLVGTIKTKTPIVDAGSQKAGLNATFDVPVEVRK